MVETFEDLPTPRVVKRSIQQWTFRRGVLRLAQLSCAKGPLLWIQCVGHATDEFIDPLLGATNKAISTGHPIIFDDWELVTGYESSVRKALTAWTLEHRPKIESTHILVKSQILAMGVSLANVAVGGHLNVYTSRAKFESALIARAPA